VPGGSGSSAYWQELGAWLYCAYETILPLRWEVWDGSQQGYRKTSGFKGVESVEKQVDQYVFQECSRECTVADESTAKAYVCSCRIRGIENSPRWTDEQGIEICCGQCLVSEARPQEQEVSAWAASPNAQISGVAKRRAFCSSLAECVPFRHVRCI
jgi:hypothetical protein